MTAEPLSREAFATLLKSSRFETPAGRDVVLAKAAEAYADLLAENAALHLQYDGPSVEEWMVMLSDAYAEQDALRAAANKVVYEFRHLLPLPAEWQSEKQKAIEALKKVLEVKESISWDESDRKCLWHDMSIEDLEYKYDSMTDLLDEVATSLELASQPADNSGQGWLPGYSCKGIAEKIRWVLAK